MNFVKFFIAIEVALMVYIKVTLVEFQVKKAMKFVVLVALLIMILLVALVSSVLRFLFFIF